MKKFYSLVTVLSSVTIFLVLIAASVVNASVLVINSDQSDPAPRAAMKEIIAKFEKENPDIAVKYNLYDKESYKTTIRNWLATRPPDIVFWYAGNRMKTFIDRGLLENVSDIWRENNLYSDMAIAKPSMTFYQKQWGIPITYYQWGIYYRKDIFKKYGLSEPGNWDEFLKYCKTLKSNGVTPIAIGTKYLWTAAGWFDYLNLRTNGLKFHIDLMDGKVPYTDSRVKKTFEHWKALIEPDYFLQNHTSYSWQEAQPFLYNGKAAMYLIGNFIVPNFPEQLNEKMGFFQFPQIDPDVGMAEDAPIDSIHIPSKAKNKADARKFLAFMARPDTQTIMNRALGQIPANNKATAPDNYFVNKGLKMLSKADGIAQFYDRDTDPAMAKEGMKGFQEFMVKPQRIDAILKRLEAHRKRIFK